MRPGVSTDDIDKAAHACAAIRPHLSRAVLTPRCSYMIEKGVYPSPLGYCGFPKSICTSVNNVSGPITRRLRRTELTS